MKVTLISHFYNEEYLLPWWLKHHSKIFDDAILIDYNSTDRSVEIIKEYCPNWTVIRSENEFFDADKVDREVMKYEETIEGYKICLNTTEFIFGDILSELKDNGLNCFEINSVCIVDDNPGDVLTYDDNLVEKKKFGFPSGNRFIHNHPSGKYSVGRHFSHLPITGQLRSNIRHFKYAPWTDEFIKRKLQISKRIPQTDIQQGMGGHHIWTREEMEDEMKIKMKLSSFLNK
jgi:hypothetical protein